MFFILFLCSSFQMSLSVGGTSVVDMSVVCNRLVSALSGPFSLCKSNLQADARHSMS